MNTGPLPPGWDCKFDNRTSRYYYINHYTKTTSWEDPREKYQQIGKPTAKDSKENQKPTDSADSTKHEHISLQEFREKYSGPTGSGGVTAGRATPGASATGRANTQPGASTSQFPPTFYGTTAAASPQPLARLQLEEAGIIQESPVSQRSTIRRDSHILAEINEMENSLTAMEQSDDQSDTEDPFFAQRYLKSVFPTVEEYLLLDVLANSENNVQKASDRLVKMGYVKRETPSAPRLHAKKKEEERLAEKRTPLPKPPPIQTEAEKEALRNKMKDKYEKKFDIPERILFMALESVLYDEDQANNLITAMIEDDLKRQKQKEAEKARERAERKKSPKPVRKAAAAQEAATGDRQPKSPKHEPKKSSATSPSGRKGASKQGKDPTPRTSRGTTMHSCAADTTGADASLAKGPDPALRKGPNDDLLLTDYVEWNGPNPTLRNGSDASLSQGANHNLIKGPKGKALGPNPANRKGPQVVTLNSCLSTGPNRQAASTRSC